MTMSKRSPAPPSRALRKASPRRKLQVLATAFEPATPHAGAHAGRSRSMPLAPRRRRPLRRLDGKPPLSIEIRERVAPRVHDAIKRDVTRSKNHPVFCPASRSARKMFARSHYAGPGSLEPPRATPVRCQSCERPAPAVVAHHDGFGSRSSLNSSSTRVSRRLSPAAFDCTTRIAPTGRRRGPGSLRLRHWTRRRERLIEQLLRSRRAGRFKPAAKSAGRIALRASRSNQLLQGRGRRV